MMKKYIQASVLAIIVVMLAGCNAAESGFNAPVGSSVTIQPEEGIEVTFAGGGEILYLATVSVLIPIGGGVAGAGAESENGNEIQGVISCGFCNLYVFKEGVETYLPQSSLLDPVAAGSFAFTSDTQGLYRFAIGVVSPLTLGFVDSEGEIVAYTDSVNVNIGVASAALEISAGPAE